MVFVCVGLQKPIAANAGANTPSAAQEIRGSIAAGPASPLHFAAGPLPMAVPSKCN